MITQQQIAESKKVFEAIYGIAPEDHHMMIYEAGIRRIDIITRSSAKMHANLEASPVFWNWWKRDWALKNIESMITLGFDPFTMPAEVKKYERDALRECTAFVHADTSFLTYPSKVLV